MNRLAKKCFVAATGLHLLLLLILLIGPAFLSSNSKSDKVPLIDFVPVKTVDSAMSGGGNPKATASPPMLAAPPPVPVPVPVPVVVPPTPPTPPVPVKEVKPPKENSDSLEPVTKPKPRKVEVSTTLVKRSTDTKAISKAQAAADAKAKTDAQRKLAERIDRTVDEIRDGLSGSTSVELKGPGGGGVPYANFLQAVKKKYSDAWTVPDGVTDDSATATAAITIARDGTVISASITRFSGNSEVDRSVKATLDRVRFAAPLPDDAKEDQRTVTINFNVKTKLLG
jgi:TonB family protein